MHIPMSCVYNPYPVIALPCTVQPASSADIAAMRTSATHGGLAAWAMHMCTQGMHANGYLIVLATLGTPLHVIPLAVITSLSDSGHCYPSQSSSYAPCPPPPEPASPSHLPPFPSSACSFPWPCCLLFTLNCIQIENMAQMWIASRLVGTVLCATSIVPLSGTDESLVEQFVSGIWLCCVVFAFGWATGGWHWIVVVIACMLLWHKTQSSLLWAGLGLLWVCLGMA